MCFQSDTFLFNFIHFNKVLRFKRITSELFIIFIYYLLFTSNLNSIAQPINGCHFCQVAIIKMNVYITVISSIYNLYNITDL